RSNAFTSREKRPRATARGANRGLLGLGLARRRLVRVCADDDREDAEVLLERGVRGNAVLLEPDAVDEEEAPRHGGGDVHLLHQLRARVLGVADDERDDDNRQAEQAHDARERQHGIIIGQRGAVDEVLREPPLGECEQRHGVERLRDLLEPVDLGPVLCARVTARREAVRELRRGVGVRRSRRRRGGAARLLVGAMAGSENVWV
ncbi:unnamed protein product, partial [Pelagomonas calceolata]